MAFWPVEGSQSFGRGRPTLTRRRKAELLGGDQSSQGVLLRQSTSLYQAAQHRDQLGINQVWGLEVGFRKPGAGGAVD
ncbi:hypothetical protein KBZ15_06945 [Cyanobium sp. BA20m-p-22]|uniref:hypothetical protein n=1 Tax=Cyanobium sp. BA20m-p-22 TaxID=2823704 RepID=UPI0020CD40D2|nr:hypothetical protein [Cyanobium sp. BA20m-p-22]MCP9909643.1 hypothetical protein [Cyanobium sp. BA20m-p-22]MCP9913350.1 hypothetical protein [Cyanobium sp. BA20m-14]